MPEEYRIGGEDDLCRHLIQRRLVGMDALAALVRERRMGGQVQVPLGEVLVEKGLIPSILEIEALRAQTRALATCSPCGAFHVIDYYSPSRAYSCTQCHAPLRPRPTAWRPPGTDESLLGRVAPGGDETLLGMGDVKPKPRPEAQESLMGRVDLGSGETLLDMGSRSPAPPSEASPQEGIPSLLGDDSTLLDMRAAPKGAPAPEESLQGLPPLAPDSTILDLSRPPLPAFPAPLPGPAPEPTILLSSSTPPAGGSTSQVDPTVVLGETPKTRTMGTSASRSSPPDATPRSSTGSGGGRAYAPLKSAPKEVVEAAKEAQRVFGKYILLKELGRGGAGVVYKAWDTTLAQFVALKFLRDQDMGDSETSTGSQAIADFQREARMSAKLRHPNIIRIYEMGSMSNRYYLSMDYIEGGALLEFIHGGKERNTDTHYHTDPKKYLGIMIKICEAVQAAHAHEPPVVHRDLKPHNVLVDKAGIPYVVDFGLAKEVELSTSAHTVTGAVKGTPSYMAPEQAEGRNKDVDARTDVYSLGAILYEMITGRPPFVGGNVRIVLNAIVTQLPDRPNAAIQAALLEKPDGAHRPRPVPRPLETICMKALEKAKQDRYQSAQELADDLKRFLNDEDISAQEPGFWRRVRRSMRQHPLITGAAAAAVLCVGVIGGALYYTSKADRSGLDKIEALAREHLEAKDWSAMKADAENLRRVRPRHPLIAEIEKSISLHDADLKARRDQWSAGMKRIAAEGPAVLEELRPAFRQAGELRQDFLEELQRVLLEALAAAENDARELVGSGADERWLKPEVKQAARTCRDRLELFITLAKDPEFPFKADAQAPALRNSLGRILVYEGLWTLRVNVAPFAKVVVRRGDQVVAEEWTPLGVRDLEVAGTYKVSLSWTPEGGPPRTVELAMKDLKHRSLVVLSGDMTRSDVKVQQ